MKLGKLLQMRDLVELSLNVTGIEDMLIAGQDFKIRINGFHYAG